jgi:catalase
VQVLQPSELSKFDFDPLDATKVWTGVPSRKVGTMTLNRNPANVFQETEQSAFAPSNVVAGIEPSEDRLLQGRVFSYADTQLHRVGVNALQLSINRPKVEVVSHNQDGAMNYGQRTGKVNYQPSRLVDIRDDHTMKYSQLPLAGTTQQARIAKTLNFRQAGEFYRSLSATEQRNLISNLAGDLGQVSHEETRYIMLSHFYKADASYGTALAQALKADVNRVKTMAAQLSE